MNDDKPDPRAAVRARLAAGGMTQAELAGLVGVAEETLSRILTGARDPAPETAVRLRDICDVPVEDWYTTRRT